MVVNNAQLELLRAHGESQEAPPEWQEAMLLSITGIAAAMQSTG
jgi:phosphoenolpyruvate carboxylase